MNMNRASNSQKTFGKANSVALVAFVFGLGLWSDGAWAGTRYEKWQKDRPFTQTAWYTSVVAAPDSTLAPAVSLPPTWPLPDMDLFHRASLNFKTTSDLGGPRGLVFGISAAARMDEWGMKSGQT